MLAIGLSLPGAVIDFNQQIFKVLTLNFRENSDYVTSSKLDSYKQGLISAGYRYISV